MDVSKIRPICLAGGYTISKIPEMEAQRVALLGFKKKNRLNKDEKELLRLLNQWFAAKKKPDPVFSKKEGYKTEDEALQKQFEEVYDALDIERTARSRAEREKEEEIRKYPGKYERGTIWQLHGTTISEGKSGHRYEVVVRDVIFDEWNKEKELVLGEKIYCRKSLRNFYVVLKNHSRWGIFVLCDKWGNYPELREIEETLAWYRQDGERPKIHNDDPSTYHYRTMIIDGVEIDALERVKH